MIPIFTFNCPFRSEFGVSKIPLRLKFFSLVGHFLVWAEFLLVSCWWLIQDFDVGKSLSLSSSLGFTLPEYMMRFDYAWNLPFHFLLPRLVYGSATVSLIFLATIFVACRGHETKEDGIARQDVHARFIGCLVAPIVLLQGRAGSLQCGIAVVRIVCFLTMTKHEQFSPIFIAGVVWFLSTHLFFGTGHFCEFSGLNFAAAFTGLMKFNYFYCGLLLAINTFGPYCLGLLTLLRVDRGDGTVVQFLEMNTGSVVELNTWEWKVNKSRSESKHTHERDRFQRMLLAVSTIQTFMTLMCMIGAIVHRRHLLIWAIFTPKLVFSGAFLIATDIMLLVLGLSQ